MKQTDCFTLKKALIITMIIVFFLTLIPNMVCAEGSANDEGKLLENATKPENQGKEDSTKEEIIERVKEIYSNIDKELNEEEVNSLPFSRGRGNVHEIKAYRENHTIIIDFDGIKIEYGNDVQIWGKNNNNHFLIKDYNKIIEGSDKFKGTFKWDITDDIDIKNASNIDKSFNDFDNIGIYVRVKHGNGNNLTYYKNFSLVEKDEFKGANLITSFDSDELMSASKEELLSRANYNTQFPAVAIEGEAFNMKLIKNLHESNMDYKVSIKGWNEGKAYKVDLQGVEQDGGIILYTWTPEYDGVFNIVVKNSNAESVIVRKVFVRSDTNNNYLSIEEVEINDENGNVQIEITPDNWEDNTINYSQLAVRVGEESVWSKTIKSYADEIKDEHKVGKKIIVSEENNKFQLSQGQYFIDALVKKQFSVEYEDAVRKYYSKKNEEGTLNNYEGMFKIRAKEIGGNEIHNPDEFKLQHTYEFKIVPDENNDEAKKLIESEDLEYAFLIWDARGKRVISDYAVKPKDSNDNKILENTFKFTFRDPGEYKVYLRVRVKKEKGRQTEDRPNDRTWILPNSYMDEVSMEVDIPTDDPNLRIHQVKITSFNKGDDELFTEDIKNQVYNVNAGHNNEIEINAHSKNIINISNVKYKGDNSLMYKVYAIHDGIWECLSQYTLTNEIPFYPRSTGEYKLIILVKDNISGSEQDRLEFNVTSK